MKTFETKIQKDFQSDCLRMMDLFPQLLTLVTRFTSSLASSSLVSRPGSNGLTLTMINDGASRQLPDSRLIRHVTQA